MQRRRAQLALLALLPLLLGSGLVTAPGSGGGGGGTGDITDVFSCASGDCNLVHVQDGESLDATGTGTIAATTAAALAANPADCPANTFATVIAANGNLTCATVTSAYVDTSICTSGGTGCPAMAPVGAKYLTQTADATLTSEHNIGLLASGLMLNTVAAGTGTVSAYPAQTCTNQFPRSTTAATGAWTCASVADADLANAYSGVGVCAATKFATTLTRNAAPTCTQPNFTDLAGTATQAQVPQAFTAVSLVTNPTDCTANQYATTIAANGNLTCAQVDFSQLTGTATAAQTPLATLVAGRSGTANNTTLSTDVSGTLYGSATSGNFLLLRANSADLTGTVSLLGSALYTIAPLTFDPDSTSGALTFVTYTDGTETVSNIWIAQQFAAGTYTVSNNTSGITGFTLPAAMILDYTPTTNPVFGAIDTTFSALNEIRPTGGAAVSGTWGLPFKAGLVFNPTNAGTVMNQTGPAADYDSVPTFKVTSGGAFGANVDRYGFHAKATVSSGTILAYRGYYFDDKTGAGTLQYQFAIDIPALSGGSVANVGVRNGSNTVYAPCFNADPGATFTITPACTYITLIPTGAARVSSATTAINDGALDGQTIYISNTGSANTVTIKAAANTDMAADCVLNRGGVAQYIWAIGESNWLQVSCSAN